MKYFYAFLLILIQNIVVAQNDISIEYYLPKDVTYNQDIPTPQDVLGYVPGKWHVSHDQLVTYMKALAKASPRITLEDRGKTFEDRPLLLLTITSEANHANLETIRKQHISNVESDQSSNHASMPIVVYQGFSIHGNEPSGSNSSLVSAYYLAAAQGQKIDDLLNHTVILFDPSLNPDGLQRFSYWANTNKSKNISTDPQDREYSEVWPGGRTNHYWFDMNRDWLPVQLPESRARITTFHKWYPNILTDHHEMGSHSTFFFQPGVQSRTHPLTPKLNQELTKAIGNFHVKALDKIGSLYYTEENFDDFYYGKGSTFPDINGGIGILFEQGSSRGHAQETDNGILRFPFTIRNQFTATLSTLEAAKNMRSEILKYQNDFYKNAKKEVEKTKDAYIFGNHKDAASTYHLAEILKRHQIRFHELKNDMTIDGKKYTKSHSYIVPKNQRQSRLIKAIFERRTSFQDSLFYDVSAWTFPLAFNMDHATNVAMSNAGNEVNNLSFFTPKIVSKSDYAYLMEWHEYYSPKALYQILDKGLRAKVGMRPFTLEGKSYDYGTIMIPVQNQALDTPQLAAFLQKVAQENHITITPVNTGLTQGIDLGSNQFRALTKPHIGLIVGNGITSYDAGEVWHLMDQRYNIPITKLDTDRFTQKDLSRYTHIILVNNYSPFQKNEVEHLNQWVLNGGTLIGYRNSARFFNEHKFMNLDFSTAKRTAKNISFEQKRDYFGAQVIGGAIFNARIDRSHPINFGYKNEHIALFRNTSLFIKASDQSYNNPIQYTDAPLLSGYISSSNLDLLKNTVPFKVKRHGRGHAILFTDNTNFRAFWYGTNKLLMNAIYFGKQM
ncbi:M14 metallopeptidase family protein [Aquimarina rhabdastrellae]